MNTAGALARAVASSHQEDVDRDALRAGLHETALGLQELMGEGGLAEHLAGFINSLEKDPADLLDRLVNLRMLVRPIDSERMRKEGLASIPRLRAEQVKTLLDEVPESDRKPAGCWLEFAPIGDGSHWVIYPQDSRPATRFVLCLPVMVGQVDTRLVPLDLGIDLTSGRDEQPGVVAGSGCDPGWTGYNDELRHVCIPGDCGHPCTEKYKLIRGALTIVDCPC
jgi:hypothetical protein